MGKKKEKVTYVDDGRTIADMSGVTGGRSYPKREAWVPRASLKEQLATFFGAMKMMIVPTLVMVGTLAVIYLVMFILFSVA